MIYNVPSSGEEPPGPSTASLPPPSKPRRLCLSAAIKSSVGRYPMCVTLHKTGCQSLWSFLGETTSKLRTQILVSRYCFLIKDPGLLGEVAGSRAGQGA